MTPAQVKAELAHRELARRHFRHFITYWAKATNNGFLPNWHVDYLADILQSVTDRDPATRFTIINMPPRHAKSTIAGVLWPAWMIGRDDSYNSAILSIASSATLAVRDSRKTMDLLAEPWYKALFPHILLGKETEAEWTTRGGAYRIAVGAEGTVTGKGANRLVVDDLLQAHEAESPVIREKRNEWLGGTLRSRLDNPKTGTVTIIQQRLHEDDSTGYLLQQQENDGADQYFHICIPLIQPTSVTVPVIFKDRIYAQREPGSLLHPDRIGPKEVTAIRLAMKHNFEAQYQQDPKGRAGGFFSAEDFIWTQPHDYPLESELSWMIGADYATSAKTTSDQTAIIAGGFDPEGTLWIHPESILAHLDPLDAVRKTVQFGKRLRTHVLGHEKGVIANTLAPLFRQECQSHKHYLSTEQYARTSGKAVHAAAFKGLCQAGKVRLPANRRAEWEYLLLRFRPDADGDKDDLIDGLATLGILMDRIVAKPSHPVAPTEEKTLTIIEQRSRMAHDDFQRRRQPEPVDDLDWG